MKITIELNVECKSHLINELNQVVTFLSRYDRYDAKRTFEHGSVSVQAEGEFANFAVVDEHDNYVSFHKGHAEALVACSDKCTVLTLTNGW